MQVDFRNNTGPHYWITVFWCAFGIVVLGAIAAISYWIRRCRGISSDRDDGINDSADSSESSKRLIHSGRLAGQRLIHNGRLKNKHLCVGLGTHHKNTFANEYDQNASNVGIGRGHDRSSVVMDITGGQPLQPVRSQEVIISCQQPQQQQLLQQQKQQPQQQQQQPLSIKQQNQKVITRSQSSKVIQELQHQHAIHQLKQQQSLPQPLHPPPSSNSSNGIGANGSGSRHPHTSKSVSILVYKTLNTVFKSSRKIIVRVCEVATQKKNLSMFKFSKAAAANRAEARANSCTGHDTFLRPPVSDKKAKNLIKKMHKQNGLKRSNSAIEFDVSALTAANRRHLYSCNRSVSSEQDNSDHSEHSEKSPLVSARLDSLARLFFSKSMPAETGSRDTIESVLTTRPNLKYQYSALDSGNGIIERSPRERAHRERALNATQEWIQNSNGRYEVIAHLDEIGSRHSKNWFLVSDSSVRTDRLMTLLPLPPDCVALDDLPPDETPKGVLMELLGSLHHPYIYPVLDLGFLRTASTNYACLVTPFNSRGSLKDLIYKTQWNEPWVRKYTRKPTGLPTSQVQRLGRQILEALLFLKERGFPLHGHLHSGNVILQNGAARLSGLENGLLGLSSRINAVMWSRSTTEIEYVDIICFGHLLYEMCTGTELTTPQPSMRMLEFELDCYPQILDILSLIFDPPAGVIPSVEELLLCDLFRSIDLRELRGPCFSTIKPSLSRSTLNLLRAVKKRQCASLGSSLSETSSPCTPPSTPRDRRSGTSRTMDSFDILSDSEEGLLDEIVVGYNCHQQYFPKMQCQTNHHHQHPYHHPFATGYHHMQPFQHQKQQQQKQYDPLNSPIHYCDNSTTHSDDNSFATEEHQQQHQHKPQQHQQQQQQSLPCSSNSSSTNLSTNSNRSSTSVVGVKTTTINVHDDIDDSQSKITKTTPAAGQVELKVLDARRSNDMLSSSGGATTSNNTSIATSNLSTHSHSTTSAAASFNHQLTADMCSYKNSKSRRLEYSLKCLKYGRSNPSQDSAFGSLTDGDISTSSFRLSSFQSISSPIDEGVEDIIIATTTAGNETCLELATIPTNMVSQDSAISSPCRELSPSNFLTIDDATSAGSYSAGSSSSGSTGNVRPQQFPVSLSPKILVTATTNSSNSSLTSNSNSNIQQLQQFDPPKILVNDQNSIYTTSPSKRTGTIEVFSQKYRVSSFEDMSNRQSSSAASSSKHLKNTTNRLAFRSLEEERRIDSAFMPIKDRTNSENRVNIQSEKYKKLTHSSFRISKTASQMNVLDAGKSGTSNAGSPIPGTFTDTENICPADDLFTRPATASGSTSTRQTMWRDSKFYRKNHIAKSNDSLLETSPNHSARISPSSFRDNQYDSYSSYSRSSSRQSLNRGCSANEISGSNQTLGLGLTVTMSNRRYCSSKSEDLGEPNDHLRVMDARKSYSERHLLSMTKLKQTAITTTTATVEGSEQFWLSEDELSFNEDNNLQHYAANNQQEQQQQHYQPKRHKHQQQHQIYHKHQHQKSQFYQQHSRERERERTHQRYVGSHSNQLSLSTCSINRITTTKIRTTSLATLSCHQNLATATAASSTATTPLTDTKAKSCTIFTKSLDHALDNMDQLSGEDSISTYKADSGAGTTAEDNSSTDESPSHQTLSAAELSKIFALDDAHGSSCSEEKTPLLDSVEMSPISPTEQEQEPNSEQM